MTRVSLTGGDEIDAQKDRPGSSNRRQPPKRPKLTPIASTPPPPPPPPVVLPSDDDDDDDDDEEEDSEDAESNDEDGESVQQVIEETSNDRSLTLTLTDPDLLNCPHCFESLKPPIFQCVKAHILCSTCCLMDNMCRQCQDSVVFDRCFVLEKIIDASRVACKNTIYGCKSMMKYHEKGDHERLCSYSPCSCPIYTCDFIGCATNLYNHFGAKHAATNFHFAYPFVASLAKHQTFLFLSEETSGTVFVLYQFTVLQGRAVCIVQIAPKTSSGKHRYELKLKDGETSLTLQSPVECVPKLDDYWPTKHFLVVEDYFCPLARVMLDIWISYAT